ncbi:MAG TPA: uroporphyrinogen-III synthase [Thermomicrobiales bacterium]|nr:uroporphyrinogen-III synthase [Thermomicrobiales bacterium]
MSAPLAGKRVLVTRARDQAGALAQELRLRGAEPVELPVIAFAPPRDPAPLEAALSGARLPGYDWVIFTSANGVDAVVAALATFGESPAALARSRLAAIGPATAARLAAHGLAPAFVPARFVAEEVLAGLLQRGVAGRRVLLPRAEEARDVLPEGLRAAGALVDVVAAYRTVRPEQSPAALDRLAPIDIVTLTSSSTARNLAALLGARRALLDGALIACIGPITARTAAEVGFPVGLVAGDYSIPGLVRALADHYALERSRP